MRPRAVESSAAEDLRAGDESVRTRAPDTMPPAALREAAAREAAQKDDATSWLMPFSAALIICASAITVLWHLQDASLKNANTGSRYATVESLVDYGTYAIDQSRYRHTVDKVLIGDHFYSSKPPLLPTYTAGVYWVYQKLTGHTIADYEGEVVWLGSLTSGWLGHLVLMIYMYRLSKLLFRRQLAIIGTVLAAGFTYLGAAYATTLNNHSVAAAFAVVGFYYTVRACREGARTRDYVLAGLALGFLPALDLPSGAISAAFGVCLLRNDWKKTLIYFATALLPGLAIHFLLTYIATGSLIPVYERRELYDYPGSYWNREAGIDALREPKTIYVFNLLLGHHGLFSMTPIFAFSLLGLWAHIKQKGIVRWIAAAVGLMSLIVFSFYVVRSHNYGGWCVGIRWLVPQMALLVVFFGVWLDRMRLDRMRLGRFKLALVVVAFGIGAYNTQDGLSGPFQFSRWHNWLQNAPNRSRTDDLINLGRAGEKLKKKHER
jgi:hypothetical protein